MGAILLKDVTVQDSRRDILISQGRIRRIGPAGAGAAWQIAGDIEMMDCSGAGINRCRGRCGEL